MRVPSVRNVVLDWANEMPQSRNAPLGKYSYKDSVIKLKTENYNVIDRSLTGAK